MLHPTAISFKFWEMLGEIDEQTTERVAANGCPHCGGRLHRGDSERKPRSGLITLVAAGSVRRPSLCCDRDGCRKRALPPSVRFLGPKVYVGPVIVLACAIAQLTTVGEAHRTSGVPRRTVRRWRSWWRDDYAQGRHFEEARSRLIPPVDAQALPLGLWERFAERAHDTVDALVKLLAFVAPITTTSVPDGSRFVRVR
jgi:hypothetical protein